MSLLHSFSAGGNVFNPNDIDDKDRIYNELMDPDKNSLNLRSNVTCNYCNEVDFNSLFNNISNQNQDVFSSFHLNVCSLPKKYDLLMQFLSTLEHKFAVLACRNNICRDPKL